MASETALAFDPACGTWLEQAQITVTHTYMGRTYAFCCAECRDLFLKDLVSNIVLLAHEPDESMGYHCPVEHLAPAALEGVLHR
jgi:YHS domain-containing protein